MLLEYISFASVNYFGCQSGDWCIRRSQDYILNYSPLNEIIPVADPVFPVGGRRPRGGCQLPRWLRFKKSVCQNKRIWTLGGGPHTSGAPWIHQCIHTHSCYVFVMSWSIFNSTIVYDKTCFYFGWIII